MNFGKITNEPSEVYHSAEAFGIHDLADLSPYPIRFHLKHVTHELPDKEDSPALAFGRYLHCLALEGEEVAGARFVEAPDGIDRRTKDGKAAWAAFQSEAAGREMVSQEDSSTAWAIVRAIQAKPAAKALFEKGEPEVVFRFAMKFFPVQARVDWFIEKPAGNGPPLIVDLKSIDRLEDFERQFLNYGYYRQAAFYRQVVKSVLKLEADPQFLFVVVEKQAPHLVSVVAPDAQSLDLGWRECERDLLTLRKCVETGVWPGSPDDTQTVSLPEWKTRAT